MPPDTDPDNMPAAQNSPPPPDDSKGEISLNAYLDAAADASRRAHNLVRVLAATCVLLVIGGLNSVDWSWPRLRFEAFANKKLPYAENMLRTLQPEEQYQAYQALLSNFHRGLIDNVYYVKLPLVNYGFDINDLTVVAGLGMSIILLLLIYSIRAEANCLAIAFKASKQLGDRRRLEQVRFYEVLAIKQVFTLPYLKTHEGWSTRRRWYLRAPPKLVYIIPAVLLAIILVNDALTVSKVAAWAGHRAWASFWAGAVILALTFVLGLSCWLYTRRVDKLWDEEARRVGLLVGAAN